LEISYQDIHGVVIFKNQVHKDSRGEFLEWYKSELVNMESEKQILFRQGNISRSAKNVIRGMHLGVGEGKQAKLVTCIQGRILDVFLDLRQNSSTYLEWGSVLLESMDGRSILIPEGVAHGFAALDDTNIVCYLNSKTYDPEFEVTVNPLDPKLGIKWPIDEPVLSEKDRTALSLEETVKLGRIFS
jgi:dTDP-4-dehydrorhamnose 3,5-epimerase